MSHPVPSRKMAASLCLDKNKKELFSFLAMMIVDTSIEKQIITTFQKDMLCSRSPELLLLLQPLVLLLLQPGGGRYQNTTPCCTRCVMQDYKKVLICTVDTDVVILAVTAAGPLGNDELWVALNLLLNCRFLPANEVAAALGPKKCRGLPVFHIFTGCDTVSCFSGRGNNKAWGTWKACDEGTDVTTLFCALSTMPNPSVVDDNIDVLGTSLFYSVIAPAAARVSTRLASLCLLGWEGEQMVSHQPQKLSDNI